MQISQKMMMTNVLQLGRPIIEGNPVQNIKKIIQSVK